MQTPGQDLYNLSVNHLIDLLISKASELLKATESGRNEDASRIATELQEIHQVIKKKRADN